MFAHKLLTNISLTNHLDVETAKLCAGRTVHLVTKTSMDLQLTRVYRLLQVHSPHLTLQSLTCIVQR